MRRSSVAIACRLVVAAVLLSEDVLDPLLVTFEPVEVVELAPAPPAPGPVWSPPAPQAAAMTKQMPKEPDSAMLRVAQSLGGEVVSNKERSAPGATALAAVNNTKPTKAIAGPTNGFGGPSSDSTRLPTTTSSRQRQDGGKIETIASRRS